MNEMTHQREACEPLEAVPTCAGCGMEPEVVQYYCCKGCKARVGFICSCGAHVVRGIVLALG